jgi:hypothetical protein
MHPAAHTIEELVEIIAAAKPTAEDIAQALGPRIPDELSELEILVKIDKYPFETASVSYPDPPLHTAIHISLTLAPGEWYLRDLAAEPERWQTGSFHHSDGWTESWRDWERPKMSIRSSCGLEGFDGPIPGRKIVRDPGFVVDPE